MPQAIMQEHLHAAFEKHQKEQEDASAQLAVQLRSMGVEMHQSHERYIALHKEKLNRCVDSKFAKAEAQKENSQQSASSSGENRSRQEQSPDLYATPPERQAKTVKKWLSKLKEEYLIGRTEILTFYNWSSQSPVGKAWLLKDEKEFGKEFTPVQLDDGGKDILTEYEKMTGRTLKEQREVIIIKSTWQQLRHYLTAPLTAKAGRPVSELSHQSHLSTKQGV